MSVLMLPSTWVFLLACISYGILLQPVECMSSMYSSRQDNSDINLESSQLATMVQSREGLLKVLLQMSGAKQFVQKQKLMNNKVAGTQCAIGPCPKLWPFGRNDNRAIKSSKLQSSIQMLNNEVADTQQLCMCFRSPCPCEQAAMIARARSEKRGKKRPMMHGKKKSSKKGPNMRGKKKRTMVNKVRHLPHHKSNS